MELKSFREILLKKAEGNPYLQTLIEYAKDDLIADEVIESLRKMAEPSAAMGRGANSALTAFAGKLDNAGVEEMRDALGHHISRYRGALKSMQAAPDKAAKEKLRGVADQHLNKIIPMMHMAGRAGKHSGGKLTLDYISTTPWESNYTTTHRHEHNGKLKEGTKDLGRRPAKSADRSKNVRAVPDYRYLEMPPHPGHGSTEKMPHKGGYPFEEVQLGHPTKRDAGQAYLPIEDVGEVKEFESHPFDYHPIHEVADAAEHHLTPEQKEKFMNDLAAWKNSEHHKGWLASQKEKFQKDPEAYKKRGLSKPGHHYEGLELLPHPEHVKASPSAASEAPATEAPAKKEEPSAVAAGPKAPSALDAPPEGINPKLARHWNTFTDEAKQDIIDSLKEKK